MKHLEVVVVALLASLFSLSAAAAKYQVAEVKNGGSIAGKVTFSGDDAPATVYAITKNPEVCGTGNREVDYVKVSDGALNDVVVYLDKVTSGKAFADGKGNLDQKGCEFLPYLQVMHNEQELEVLNSDPVSHNIHTYELIGKAKRTVMNISQPKQGSVIKKMIKLRKGVGMKIECDQHDFMHGFVFVARNPYYAIVGGDGSFEIKDVPPGEYEIKAWHGTLGEQKTGVTVEGGKAAAVNFEFK